MDARRPASIIADAAYSPGTRRSMRKRPPPPVVANRRRLQGRPARPTSSLRPRARPSVTRAPSTILPSASRTIPSRAPEGSPEGSSSVKVVPRPSTFARGLVSATPLRSPGATPGLVSRHTPRRAAAARTPIPRKTMPRRPEPLDMATSYRWRFEVRIIRCAHPDVWVPTALLTVRPLRALRCTWCAEDRRCRSVEIRRQGPRSMKDSDEGPA
jgi:hypothetical protein